MYFTIMEKKNYTTPISEIIPVQMEMACMSGEIDGLGKNTYSDPWA